jgi:CRP-like cAMP-binding protein
LYFVIDGKVRVLREARPPTDLAEGEVFGEMSVLDSSPRSDTVQVLDDATLLRIGQEDFYEVLYGTAELAQGVIHVLVRRLRAATAGQ